jgi:hypothetical protein
MEIIETIPATPPAAQPELITPVTVTPQPKGWPRRWKKRYLGLLIAAVLFVGVNLLIQALEPALLDTLRYRDRMFSEKIVLYQSQPRPDVLIMGSSIAGTGFNPLVIEQEFFNNTGYKIQALNLGISGSSADLNYLILKNIIKENKKPSVIIYALSDLELRFKHSFNQSKSFENIAYGKRLTRLDDFGDYSGDTLDSKADFLLRQFFPVYRDRRLLQDSLSLQFNPADPDHYKYVDKVVPDRTLDTGFRGLPDYTKADSTWLMIDIARQRAVFATYDLDDVDLTDLSRFLKLAQQRNIKVILVNVPVAQAHRDLWPKPDQPARFQEIFKNLSQQYNVPFENLYGNEQGLFKPEDFSDSIHLSDSGATIQSILVTRDFLVKEFKKPLTPPDPPPPDFYRASLTGVDVLPRLPSLYNLQIKVRVANLSPYLWPLTGPRRITLAYRWFNEKKEQVGPDGLPTELQFVGAAGNSEEVLLKIHTPDDPGNYNLHIDLHQENGPWFSSQGNPALNQPVVIYERNDTNN